MAEPERANLDAEDRRADRDRFQRARMSGLLNIALDATYSTGKQLSGVGVYSRELLRELARLHPEAAWTWCYRSQRWRAAFSESLAANGGGRESVRRRPLFESWAPRANLFHGLNQRLPAFFDQASSRRRTRTIATFHDLFVITRDYSEREFRERFIRQAREAARRADAIIAISRFTACEVESLLNVEPARIHVVHHGVRPLVSSADAAAATASREPIILSVGALQTRKNTLGLVRAFERLPDKTVHGWRLVLAGSRGYGAEQLVAEIERSPRRGAIEMPGWIDDRQLADLYARASVFAFPSLDEGFGIPVIEAMAAGIPVLASNSSSMPEVCGDAAIQVEPGNSDALEDALRKLVEDAGLRERMNSLGRQWAARFTWERSARSTWDVYQKVLGR